jgi:hypothetical protein
MRKLNEIEGFEAIEILADAMDLVSAIRADKVLVAEMQAANGDNMKIATLMLRRKSRELAALLEKINGGTFSLADAPGMLSSLMSDPAFRQVFISAGQEGTPSGSATANTGATAEG